MARKIYALLVAINEYHPASSPKVSRLFACVNDKNRFQDLLEKQYNCKPEQIKSLVNSNATKETITYTFKKHLCENPAIKEGDVILFYYGGHGSYTSTSVEFEIYDSKKQDETLVCYDSRHPLVMEDLRDKEIAALIAEVPIGVEIVVIIDSCHSGSITRNKSDLDSDLNPRYIAPIRATKQSIPSYSNSREVTTSKKESATIPKREHISFSACNRDQHAWEKNGRGVFTHHLLNVLEKSKGFISYAQLYKRLSISVLKDVKNQTPEFLFPNHLDPNTIFLQEKLSKELPSLLVEYRNEKWCLNHGAIYGLPVKKEIVEKIQVAIYEDSFNSDQLNFLGNVNIENVKLKECHLSPDLFEANLGVKDPNNFFEKEDKRKKITFLANIILASPNLVIYLNGSEKDKEDFLKKIKISNVPFIGFSSDSNQLKYELVLEKEQMLINDLETGKLIHGCYGQDKKAIDYILDKLNQMEEWSRLVELNNEMTKLDTSQVEVKFKDESTGKDFKPSDIILDFLGDPIFYKIVARNKTDKLLYISLVNLNRKFGIDCFYPCTELLPDKREIILDDQHGLFIPADEDIQSATDIFKVIISTEKFEDYRFLRNDIELGKIVKPELTRDLVKKPKATPPEKDWLTYTFLVNVFNKKML